MLIGLAIAVVAWWLVWETCGLRGCPSVDLLAAYQPGGAPVVLDRDGDEVARLSPVSRDLVALSELPDHVADAFLAVEDKRFYEHGGVDWRRFGGSMLANVKAGGVAQGASTITMQLARNVFPERLPGAERTPRRKLLEMRVAREIEARFTKDEILELYLNHIYFGGSLYGVESAARHYFGGPARDLSLAEAATLAAMPKAPNSYNPREHPERARERRDLVLDLMAAQGRITAEEAEDARDRRVRVARERPSPDEAPPPAPYFVRAVRRILEEELGDALYASPLRIHTTLDPDAQAAAEQALGRQLRSVENGAYGRFRGAKRYGAGDAVDASGTRYLQGSVVVMRADSGDVLALVGGRDYDDSPFDRATQARRPVGSAFKPFVYAAAVDDGYAPSQHLTDEPLEMELTGGELWKPQNFGGGYQGEVTLREAAVHSNNVATVRLAMAVGMDDVVETARRAGVRGRLHELPSLALGTAGLTLLELTAAYTPFADRGVAASPRFVTLVEDTTGETVWRPRVDRDDALDPAVAYLVTDLLRDAVDRGTGRAVRDAGFRGAAAGKTGTTDDGHDVWFVGYTPELVGGVWIGFDRPSPVVDRASGGRLAAPVWGRMMRQIYRNREGPGDWERPEDVVEREIDPASGLVLADGCRPETGSARSELFLESALPAAVCPAGEREDRGFFGRIADAVTSAFRSAGRFIAGLFRGDEDEEDAERERYLGRPRLPRASEVREPVVDPDSLPEPLGVPLDSIPGWGDEPAELDTEAPEPELEPGDTILILRPEDAGSDELPPRGPPGREPPGRGPRGEGPPGQRPPGGDPPPADPDALPDTNRLTPRDTTPAAPPEPLRG